MVTKVAVSMLVVVFALVIVADVRDWQKWIALMSLAFGACNILERHLEDLLEGH